MSDDARILVIDDDRGVVDLWTEVLGEAGFRAVGETEPTAGLARATEEAFDLVLCDVEMPGLRGPELMRRLLEARPSQLVVLITAFGSIDSAVEALREGAADFVSKPCGPESLVHVVRRALRERRLRREVVRLRRRAQPEGKERDDHGEEQERIEHCHRPTKRQRELPPQQAAGKSQSPGRGTHAMRSVRRSTESTR